MLNVAAWTVAALGGLACLSGIWLLQARRHMRNSELDASYPARTLYLLIAIGLPAWLLPTFLDWLNR